MEKTKQKMRYNDSELELIKRTFADNDDLLTAVRKHLLQMEMSKTDKELIKIITNSKDLLKLVRKTMLPTLEADAPRHQLVDLWMTIKLEDKSPEMAYPHLMAREILINYLDQQLSLLEGQEVESYIVFADLVKLTEDSHETFANINARNTVIGHVELQLSSLLILAGYKEESVEQTKKRLEQNSAK